MLSPARHHSEDRTNAQLWRSLGYYFVLTCVAGIGLGLLGNAMAWNGTVSFVALLLVGTPISFMALRRTLSCLEDSDRRRRHRHSSA
jgi:hypothetical protein